jgi:hypothetical protein
MKTLFCVVVTDPSGEVGLDSPIIYHVKCDQLSQAEDEADRLLEEEFGPNLGAELDIFAFEVTDLAIIELV